MEISDRLRREDLESADAEIGRRVVVKDVTGSTNDDAAEMARSGAEHGAVVVAERQESGRGRLDRKWRSPAGRNLLFSTVLRKIPPPEKLGLVTISAGVGVATAIKELTGLPAMIKWPNDVRVGGRKLCGILCEAGGVGGVDYVIAGVGLNVNMRRAEMAPEIRDLATSLYEETGREWKRSEVFRALARELGKALSLALADVDRALGLWTGMWEAGGRRVRAVTPSGVIVGVARGVCEDGALLVETDTGVCRVVAGDVALDDTP